MLGSSISHLEVLKALSRPGTIRHTSRNSAEMKCQISGAQGESQSLAWAYLCLAGHYYCNRAASRTAEHLSGGDSGQMNLLPATSEAGSVSQEGPAEAHSRLGPGFGGLRAFSAKARKSPQNLCAERVSSTETQQAAHNSASPWFPCGTT